MRVLDLFCGCGGLSHGFGMAEHEGVRYEIVGGLDFSRPSMKTFALNHPNALPIDADIRKVSVSDIAKMVGDVDVLIGGPSCQGFSTQGKRLSDDPRNFLYTFFMKFVAEIKPKWVLIENVTGLLRYQNGFFRDNIVDDFIKSGYAVSFAQLQAADYGVPQVRKRVFFVANRSRIPFFFPQPTHRNPELNETLFDRENSQLLRPYMSLRDAISDLPALDLGCDKAAAPTDYVCAPMTPYQAFMRNSADALSLHYGTPVPAENYRRIRHIPPGGDWLDIPSDLLPSRFDNILPKDATTVYYRLKWGRPAYTITTTYRNVSSGAFTHPDEDRALTHREAARIQSFPDTFRFSEQSIPAQIGNAVPPILASKLAQAILVHDATHSETKSWKDLTLFEQQVRAHEPWSAPFPAMQSPSSVPTFGLEGFSHLEAPLTDEHWAVARRILHKHHLDTRSQVNLRGVLNELCYASSHGQALNWMSGDYYEPATVVRLLADWRQRGVLKEIFEKIERSQKQSPSGSFVISEVSNTFPIPKRRRSRPNAKHHFGTIQYPIDPVTCCTTSNVEVIFKK